MQVRSHWQKRAVQLAAYRSMLLYLRGAGQAAGEEMVVHGRQTQVLLLDLRDDPAAIAVYRQWHRPGGPPAAVTRAIRDAGILSMEIWQVADRLVMLMETGPDYDPAEHARRNAADPQVQAWEQLMDRFQQRLPFATDDTKWVPAERIFDLTDHADPPAGDVAGAG